MSKKLDPSNFFFNSSGQLAGYFAQLTLAGIICALALLEDSQEGVIGCMLISPLMLPIIGSSIALLQLDKMNSFKCIMVVLLSILLLIACGKVVASVNLKPANRSNEVNKRTNKWTKTTWVFAALVGILVGLSLVSSKIDTTEMIGVGVAVSLLPPIVNAGILHEGNFNSSDDNTSARNSLNIGLINAVSVFIMVLLILWLSRSPHFAFIQNVFHEDVGKVPTRSCSCT